MKKRDLAIIAKKGENALVIIRAMIHLLNVYDVEVSLPVYLDLEQLLAESRYTEAAGAYYWRKRELGRVVGYGFVSDVMEQKVKKHCSAAEAAMGNLRAYLDYGIDRQPVSLPEAACPEDRPREWM